MQLRTEDDYLCILLICRGGGLSALSSLVVFLVSFLIFEFLDFKLWFYVREGRDGKEAIFFHVGNKNQ